MTTPERLRRRQRYEGVILILLALLTTGQAVYSNTKDAAQQECMERKFSQLSRALDARANLAERETSQNKKLWLIYAHAAGALKDDPTAELTPKDQARFQKQLVAQLLEYKKVITAIEKDRRDHPVPPYPVGACDEK